MLKLDWTDSPATGEYATVYVVFELSKTRWQLGVLLPGSEKLSRYPIAGGDLTALASGLARCRAQAARSGKSVRIVSCYEAGLDGHWLHRWLTDQGVVARPGRARCPAAQAGLHRESRQDANRRRSDADAMAQGGDHARARAAVPRRQAVERA